MSAPELIGDTWIGTGGRRLGLGDLRGRIVLLDFWTLCCVNCHHVLAELRPIEAKYRDVLTVVGVHSPKFDHEKDPQAVRAAVERHGIEHPVLNDPNLATWSAYGVRAWPTLVVLDPAGEVAAQFSGEGHGHAIDAVIADLVRRHEAAGDLRRGPDVFVPLPPSSAPYAQPGKVARLGEGRLMVSESGRHRLVIAAADEPNAPQLVIGSGERGLIDGPASQARFSEPYGVAVLPSEVAQQLGYDLVVADAANHALRGIDSSTGDVRTVAGTGEQWMQGDAVEGPARRTRLSTPWDVTWADDAIVVAMAGEHRLWRFDPLADTVAVLAGTTNEGLVDGPIAEAWFAQPSAVVADGVSVYVVDAETSAIRRMRDGRIETLVGRGLFDFGHRDGPATEALLQHPLGADLLPDGSLVIADAYNGALRRLDPRTGEVSTLARDLAEPSDVLVIDGGAAVLVVEAAAGRLTRLPLGVDVRIDGEAMRTTRPALRVAPGEIVVEVVFDPPPGEKRDDRFGPSTQLVVSASPPGLLATGAGRGTDLIRPIEIVPIAGDGVLHVAAKGASCDAVDGDEAHAACHIHQQDWGVPIVIDPQGERVVRLVLSGS